MKSFDTDLKKYAEKVSLKASERRELRERILSYMEYHPLPKQAARIIPKRLDGIQSEPYTAFHFSFRSTYVRIAAGVFVLILLVVPFAAERSMPGDALYLVKTGFNESVQGSLTTSPYKKIEFETKLMERRIAEARVLADEGKLTEEVKTQIAGTVKEHADAVQSGIAALRTKDADGAAIAGIGFNASLEVQSAVLDGDESIDNASLIDTIRTVVNDARQEVATNQGTDKPSFESLSARIEVETTRAYELFETVKQSATPEEIRDIDRRLSDIDRLILEAKESQGDNAIATPGLSTTLGLIQKLIVFMTDINIRESVTLESIVPVVLSGEERVARVTRELTRITDTQTLLTQQLESVTDPNIKDKVSEGLTRLRIVVTAVAQNLKDRDIENAELALEEGTALVNDMALITREYIIPVPETTPGAPVKGTVGTTTATTSTSVELGGTEEKASSTPEVFEGFPVDDEV